MIAGAALGCHRVTYLSTVPGLHQRAVTASGPLTYVTLSGEVGFRPEIYPLYWSSAQMQARQTDRVAKVQAFLNAQWTSYSEGTQWFDPDRDSLYLTASAVARKERTPPDWAATLTPAP
jgi:hypothetical protein